MEEKNSDGESSIFVPKFLDLPPHDDYEEQFSSDQIGDIRSSINSLHFRGEDIDNSPGNDLNTLLGG